MSHWKLTLSYHGGTFHGWQIQPGLTTVQGRLADALKQITGETVLPQGSGRTDAGVHALAQVASFALRTEIPAPNMQRALNRVLPPSVRVLRAEIVPGSFHARHSSRRKTYEYRIFERSAASAQSDIQLRGAEERICSPFLAPFVWDCRWSLDLDRLKSAAALLPGTRDFTSLAAAMREPKMPPDGSLEPAPSRPNPVKTIFSSDWFEAEGLLVYRISGSGFLHHMVRNLVGTMVDIGRGSLKIEDLNRILEARDRSQAGPTAPACGLYLVGVDYSEDHCGDEITEISHDQSQREVPA